MKINSPTQKGLMAKILGSRHSGFTLIELLATLTIMAVIASLLFPFISNYTAMANKNTNIRSMRMMQDAMDRFRSINPDFAGWGASGSSHGSGNFANYTLLTDTEANAVIASLTSPGDYQTLRTPVDGLSSSNVIVIRTAPSTNTSLDVSSWEIMRYRRKTDGDGVDRKGNIVSNANFTTVQSSDIDAAFSN